MFKHFGKCARFKTRAELTGNLVRHATINCSRDPAHADTANSLRMQVGNRQHVHFVYTRLGRVCDYTRTRSCTAWNACFDQNMTRWVVIIVCVHHSHTPAVRHELAGALVDQAVLIAQSDPGPANTANSLRTQVGRPPTRPLRLSSTGKRDRLHQAQAGGPAVTKSCTAFR